MNAFFLKALDIHKFSGIKDWTKDVDLFEMEKIVVPVHERQHWTVAIIYMKNETFKYYDSMGAPNNVVLNALANYLQTPFIWCTMSFRKIKYNQILRIEEDSGAGAKYAEKNFRKPQ